MDSKTLILSITLIALLNQITMAKNSERKTETPKYEVINSFGSIEIREYPELIMATTTLGDSYSSNSGRGFSTVAGYIFGGNEENKKISMTAPVVVEMSDKMEMSFIMPSKYTMDQLPKPSDSRISVHEERSKILAVIRFKGFVNDKKMKEYKMRLKAELDKNNLTQIGEYMFFGYNPPYRLINRRNEIAVEIKWDK